MIMNHDTKGYRDKNNAHYQKNTYLDCEVQWWQYQALGLFCLNRKPSLIQGLENDLICLSENSSVLKIGPNYLFDNVKDSLPLIFWFAVWWFKCFYITVLNGTGVYPNFMGIDKLNYFL